MSIILPWRTLNYLDHPDHSVVSPTASSTLKATLEQLQITTQLKQYIPTLAGAYAIGVPLDEESVTFLCEVYSVDTFRDSCETLFGHYSRFQVVEKPIDGDNAVIARWKFEQQQVELIGQPRPVEDQSLFQLTVLADRLLKLTDSPLAYKQTLWEWRKLYPKATFVQMVTAILGETISAKEIAAWVEKKLEQDDTVLVEKLTTTPSKPAGVNENTVVDEVDDVVLDGGGSAATT